MIDRSLMESWKIGRTLTSACRNLFASKCAIVTEDKQDTLRGT